MPSTLAKIKSMLDSHIGKKLTVTSHVGRKKILTRKGKLSETFPAVLKVQLSVFHTATRMF